MTTWCIKDGQNREILCECVNKPFDYLETVLTLENVGLLPKGLYSDKYSVQLRGGWCNSLTTGHYQVPQLVGVLVPDGTFEKLGITYLGEPVKLI